LKQKLWHEYTHGKQTLIELGEKHERTPWWVRNKLDECKISTPKDIIPQAAIIVPDTTFWGRSYGVCVFRSWNLKRNIWWNEVPGEKVAHYHYGRKILEERGWVFLAAVVDGRRGLATVFKDIPVQICHFHQMKNVTKYLTRRPETLAGQELRLIMLTLPKANEKEFTKLISKERIGTRNVKHYDKALTPYKRLLKLGILSKRQRRQLYKVYSTHNPQELTQKIRVLQDKLRRACSVTI